MSNITILHLDVDMKNPELAGMAINSAKTSRDWLTIMVNVRERPECAQKYPDFVLSGEKISTRYAETLVFTWLDGKYAAIGDTYGTQGEVNRILKDVSKAYKYHSGVKVLTKLKYKVKQTTRPGVMVAHGRRY